MTKMKGHKKPKTLFTQKRIERKQTRHLTGEALAAWAARKIGMGTKETEPVQA